MKYNRKHTILVWNDAIRLLNHLMPILVPKFVVLSQFACLLQWLVWNVVAFMRWQENLTSKLNQSVINCAQQMEVKECMYVSCKTCRTDASPLLLNQNIIHISQYVYTMPVLLKPTQVHQFRTQSMYKFCTSSKITHSIPFSRHCTFQQQLLKSINFSLLWIITVHSS